ncbi:MAG: GatB/YqeY domain-containing protein [Deltaproteobacteria bacterium]|nr:GatB/YqeY domain-containing protein [Deltaproteobacteria bacterium]
MGIEQQLTENLKNAMKAKKAEEVSVIRMVKTAATLAKAEPGFSNNDDDTFWQDVIGKYVKQQSKALVEFQKVEGADEQIAQIKYEMDYLTPFLPAKFSKEETEKLVEEAIKATGADNIRLMGKVMGFIMKSHKDKIDGTLVKEIIESKLS